MIKYLKLISIMLMLYTPARAQLLALTENTQPINYKTYLDSVGKNNLHYAIEKFNVNIAKAAMLTAGIFPDPEVSIGYADNGEKRMQMGYSFNSELSWVIELGKKRKARINLAASETQLTNSLLTAYFKDLRADATLAYLQAIFEKHVLQSHVNSYEQLVKLAHADSIRYSLGAISEVDARQSTLEANTQQNEVYAAEAASKIALANISLLMGVPADDNSTLFSPEEVLVGFHREFNLPDLIITAQNNRTDLEIALQDKAVSQHMLALAKANRVIDLGISLGVEYNSYAHNAIAPTPSFTKIGAGISIPLKFSNKNKGELQAAAYRVAQTDLAYKATEARIANEILQAYYKYESTKEQLKSFQKGLLTHAQEILNGKVYSYSRGETSLLEVIHAQRTYNDVQLSYFQTLYQQAEALIALERAVGIWDIVF